MAPATSAEGVEFTTAQNDTSARESDAGAGVEIQTAEQH